MYCGAMLKEVNDVTLKELLKLIPDSLLETKISISNNSKFYIHLDMDGEKINLDPRPWPVNYGERAEGNSCKNCDSFIDNECKCDGSNCMNYQALISKKSVYESKYGKITEDKDISKNDEVVETKEETTNVVTSETEVWSSMETMIEKALVSALTKMINSLEK